MKKFKDLIEADAKDYKGDGESQKDYDTASSDEEKFKQLHFTHNADLAKMGREHPVAPDYVFTGERPGGTKGDAGADHKGYEKPGEPILKTYKDFIASMRSAAKSGGDKTPVMQGSSKIKEEVELVDEAKYKYDGKVVKISKKEFAKVPKDYKNTTKGKERMMILDPKTQASISVPVQFEEVELVDEAFKKGMLKLKDGNTVKIDEKTAKFLNDAMKQLNPGNRKKMETEAMKDKKSFEAMVDFAKAAA